MKSLITFVVSLAFITGLSAQTVIIDFTEKTLEKEYVIHFLESQSDPKTLKYDNLAEARTKLIEIMEGYQKDGFNLASSTISSHKHWRWFKKGLHYHYQYILQHGANAMMPVMPGREMNQPPRPENRNRRREQMNNSERRQGQGQGRGGGNRNGTGGGSMNHNNSGGSGAQGGQSAPPPPPPPLDDPNATPPAEQGGGGGSSTPPPRPNQGQKNDGSDQDGRKVPQQSLGKVKIGPN